MKKTIRNIMMLGAVSALVACSGTNWKKTDFAGSQKSLEDYTAHVNEVIDYENLKLKAHHKSLTEEHIKGNMDRIEIDETTFEADIPNSKFHIRYYSKDFMDDKRDSDYNSDLEDAQEIWYSYNAKKGIVGQHKTATVKEYAIIATPETIANTAKLKNVTEKEVVKSFFVELAGEVFDPSAIFSSISYYVNLEEEIGFELTGYEDLKGGVTYYTAGEGSAKYSGKFQYSYDDKCLSGYDVKVTETRSLVVKDWIVNEKSGVYKETGNFYVTETEKVDYTYVSTDSMEFTKNPSISIPSLSGYVETTVK